MGRVRLLAVPAALSLAMFASQVSAAPIISVFTSDVDLLAQYPPGTTPQDLLIALEEFMDPVLDGGLTPVGGGGTITDQDGGGGGGYWSTTGPFSFQLDTGAADGFVLFYLAVAAGVPAPTVEMTLADGSFFTVGPLVGGPSNGGLFFAFTSSEPFKAVSLDLDAGVIFRTDVAGFFNNPAPAVPEPSTLLLLAGGLLASARRVNRLGRRPNRG
jgi:hypothetical protein